MTFKEEHPKIITISYEEYQEYQKLKYENLQLFAENSKLKSENDSFISRLRSYIAIGSVLFAFTLMYTGLLEYTPKIKWYYLIILIIIGSYIGKIAVILLSSALVSLSSVLNNKLPYSTILLAVIASFAVLFFSGYFSADEKLEEKRQTMLEESVYITSTGMKYHNADCYLIDGNFAQEITVGSAIDDGFTPCAACNPLTEEDIENALATPDDVKSLKAQIETLKQENTLLENNLSYVETSYQEFKDTKGQFVDEGIYYHSRVCIVDLIEPNSHYHKFGSDCTIQAPYIMTVELAESPEVNKTYCPKCYENDDIFFANKLAESNTSN